MEKFFLDNPWIIVLILIWTLPWKAAALWRAARRGHLGWFLTIILLNTLAILDILYIFVFSRPSLAEKQQSQDARQSSVARYRERKLLEQANESAAEEGEEPEIRQASNIALPRKRPTVI